MQPSRSVLNKCFIISSLWACTSCHQIPQKTKHVFSETIHSFRSLLQKDSLQAARKMTVVKGLHGLSKNMTTAKNDSLKASIKKIIP